MHSPRLRVPRLFWPAAIVLALAIAACSAWQASPSAPTGLPDGIPIPANASVVVGQGGYDAGATLYGFSSDLAPASAIQGYEAQLTAAGFQRTGSNGPWQLYRHGTMQVAVRAGQSGPPTTLLVRVSTVPGTAAAGGTSTAGNASSTGRASGTGGTGSGHASGGGNGGAASHANGNPNPGANGASNGNAKGRASPTPVPNSGGTPTAAPNGNGNPNPGSNGNPNPGANRSATPVPQPPPPNGQPTTPPGQVGRTPPPGAARTPKP